MAGTDDTRDLGEELLRLERALAVRDASGIEGGLGALIAADFIEFGQSGRTWDAPGTLELLAAAPPSDVAVALEDTSVDRLAGDVALLTYRLTAPGFPSTNRASVWVRRDGRWLLRFHQGTRTADPVTVDDPAPVAGASVPSHARGSR